MAETQIVFPSPSTSGEEDVNESDSGSSSSDDTSTRKYDQHEVLIHNKHDDCNRNILMNVGKYQYISDDDSDSEGSLKEFIDDSEPPADKRKKSKKRKKRSVLSGSSCSDEDEPSTSSGRKKRSKLTPNREPLQIFNDRSLCDRDTDTDQGESNADNSYDVASSSDEDALFKFDLPSVMGIDDRRELEHLKKETKNKLREIQDTLRTKPTPEDVATEPLEMRIPLMQHQRHALAFMIWREEQSEPGGIIADEMGN